ncbi:cytochrome P450 [Apodospora peruviana]|uniref:Cytochrome P450 n=1 Tax=Apodospora peruviana TaxID=516989 RepID=A0AAE0IRK0_9PEZI|nr:cytochrome P450 [Apodospora peruviana]
MFAANQLSVVAALAAVTVLFLQWLLFSNNNSKSSNKQNEEFWSRLDTVGIPSGGIIRRARGLIGSLTSMAQNTHEGYNKFCKGQNRPFALPTMWTGKAVVVLPPSQLHLVNRPESELTGFWALIENIQLPYFIPDRDVIENVIHFEVSRKDLTRRNVDRQAAPTAEEVDLAFRELWGDSKTAGEWKMVNGWDMCGAVIARVALRTLVGSPMCRNETLLELTRKFADSLFGAAAVINCTPPFLRPAIGPLLALPAKFYGARCRRIIIPLVKERIRLWQQHQNKDPKQKHGGADENDTELPNDFLQWLIPRCAGHGPEHMDPSKIAMRFLALNTMFVFAMSYVFSSTVIDLCASPDRDEFLSGMEEECRRVLADYHGDGQGGLANKEAVDRLYRVDSAIRESMRVSDVGVVTLPRDVVGDKPLDLGGGVVVPPGTRLVYPTQSIHLDRDYHDDPLRFDAFRFSRPMEKTEQHNDAPGREKARELMVTLTPGFLAFGYGKRACPGRWFVAQTLKQALAYLVMNYEVGLAGPVPKRKTLLNMMIPPTGVKLRFRRKGDEQEK